MRMRWISGFVGIGLAATSAALLPGIVAAADAAKLEAPMFRPGDTWVYDRTHERGLNGFSQERVRETIERVDSDDMVLGVKLDGATSGFQDHLVGLDLSERNVVNGQTKITERLLSFPMEIGDTWQEDFVDPRRQGVQTSVHVQQSYKVIGWEDVTTPAGTFHALKIEAHGKLTAQVSIPAVAISGAQASGLGVATASQATPARNGVVTQLTYRAVYYVPTIKSYVKVVYEQYDSQGVRTKRDTSVLASFTPG